MQHSLPEKLDANGVVIDIGRAHEALKAALAPLNYRNLDDLPELKGINTTTEFLTKHIFDRLAKAARAGKLGRAGARTQGDPRHTIGIARSAGLVRGEFVVKRFAFAVPGDLSTPTGGYAYDRRMIAELGKLGWQIDIVDLGQGFPFPSEATRKAAHERLLALPADRVVVVDGLALGVLPEMARALRRLLALVHHPLAVEIRDQQGAGRKFARQRTSGAIGGAACCGHQRRNGGAVVVPLRRSRGAHDRGAARIRSGASGAAQCGR